MGVGSGAGGFERQGVVEERVGVGNAKLQLPQGMRLIWGCR